MDSKDFGFLYRKEFIILCLLLIGISFAQIASEQQLSVGTRTSGVDPIFILRNQGFEALGIFLPIFTAIYLLFQKRSKEDYSWLPPGKYLAVFTTLFILILAIPVPSTSEDISPDNNTNTVTITSPISTTSPPSIITSPEPTSNNNDPSINSQFLGNFLNIARNAFFFLVLFLPLLIIYLIHHRSKTEADVDTDIAENDHYDNEKAHLARTILECYYQTSNRLEERGADDSPAFTPIEFLKDGIDKKLIPPQDIKELTKIFEEAKFSNNEMTNEQVEIAKKIAKSIIFAQEEIIRDFTSKSMQKSKEENP